MRPSRLFQLLKYVIWSGTQSFHSRHVQSAWFSVDTMIVSHYTDVHRSKPVHLIHTGGSVSYIGKSAGSHASAEESVRTAVRTRRRLIQTFKNLGLSRSFARGP